MAHASTPAKQMNVGYFIAAAVFLFNPCINIVDILPDFFGYLFLLKAIEKWSDLCPKMADAYAGIARLRWFMLIKMLAMILVPQVDDTYVLVLTFGFAVIEMIYLLPAIGRIFDGFEYFGTRFESRAVYRNLKNAETITYLFFVGKTIFNVLPEFCSLSTFDNLGYVTSGVQIDYGNYKYALVLIGIFLTFLLGIMWLIHILPYFNRIGRETPFLTRVLNEYHNEVETNGGLQLRRSLKSALTLLFAGLLFMLNLWIDEVNVIPNVIGGFFFIAASLKFHKMANGIESSVALVSDRKSESTRPQTKPLVIFSIVYTVVSALSYGLSVWFAYIYPLRTVTTDFAAYEFYNFTRIAAVTEYLVLAVFGFYMIRELHRLIVVHLSPKSEIDDTRIIGIYSQAQRELDKSYLANAFFSFAAIVMNLITFLTRDIMYTDFREFWLIPFLVTLAWIIYSKVVFSRFYEQIEYKYL